jgi:hypothetical protein
MVVHRVVLWGQYDSAHIFEFFPLLKVVLKEFVSSVVISCVV